MSAPQAFRLGWNKLHIGHPTGRGYRGVCGRMVECTEEEDEIVLYVGLNVGLAWEQEVVCLDCDRKVQQALEKRRGLTRRSPAASRRGTARAA